MPGSITDDRDREEGKYDALVNNLSLNYIFPRRPLWIKQYAILISYSKRIHISRFLVTEKSIRRRH